MPQQLPVLYEDDDFVAVYKPHDLLVHKTELSTDRVTAMHIVRDMVGCYVDPVHRLDRATTGVLLFSKNKKATKFASDQFMNKEVSKSYLAIIRGWPQEDHGSINTPIKNDRGQELEALTEYKVLAKMDYPHAVGRFKSSWYSLLRTYPHTGRMHQIRRHMKRLCGPVIGDTQHGDGKHNQLFRDKFNSRNLLLFAETLTFKSFQNEKVEIKADLPDSFRNICRVFNWSLELTAL